MGRTLKGEWLFMFGEITKETFQEYGIYSEMDVKRVGPALCRALHIEPFIDVSKKWHKWVDAHPGDTSMDTSEDVIEEIKADYRWEMEGVVDPDEFEELWRNVEPFMRNPAFALYFRAFCMESYNFVHWLTAAPALKVLDAFGISYDLHGRLEETPKNDPHFWWSQNLTIMQYLRWRACVAAWIVEDHYQNTFKRIAKPDDKQMICSLGAGGLPEFTMVHYKLEPEIQEVLAFDTNPPQDLLDYYDERRLMDGISYYRESFLDALKTRQLYGKFDVVTMNGLMSYLPEDKREQVILGAAALLKPGGIFGFDLQMEYPEMEWADTLFGWSEKAPIYLSNNVEYVRKTMEGVATRIGLSCVVYPYKGPGLYETIGLYITMTSRI